MSITRLSSILSVCLLLGCQGNGFPRGWRPPPFPSPLTLTAPLHQKPMAEETPVAIVATPAPVAVELSVPGGPFRRAPMSIKGLVAAAPVPAPVVEVFSVPPVPFQSEPVLVTVSARQEDSPLTLERVQQIALAQNPSLAEARAGIEAAKGKRIQAGLPPNTVLGFSGQQLGSSGEAEQLGLFVGQEFIGGDKLQLSQAIVDQEILAAKTTRLIQKQRVLTDVRLGFYEVLVAEQQETAVSELVELAQQAVAAAEALLEAKEVGRIDVMRARIELQSEQLALKKASDRLTAAWSRLIATIGMPAISRGPLESELAKPVPTFISAELVTRLLKESPELTVARIRVDRARRAVERAAAEPIPDIDVQAIVQHDNGTNGANANLQVSFPIPWQNRNQGEIQRAKAEVIIATRSVERVELDLRQRLAVVYQRYNKAGHELQDYASEGGIIDNSREVLDLVRRGYQAGELRYLDLIMAQRNYSKTKLAYIDSLGQVWSAVIEIDGLLLKGSLQSRPE